MNSHKFIFSSVEFTATAVMLLILICLPFSAQALRFQSYTNEKGETVFSNLPAKCIEKGRLTCLQHHPLSAKPKRATTPQKQSTRNTRPMTTTTRAPISPEVNSEADLFDMLDEVVEIKQLLDKYYPAAADPETERSVKEQQQQIMNTLKLIRNVANQQELPSIERAIDIFQTHRID
jgi:hypothetical protein